MPALYEIVREIRSVLDRQTDDGELLPYVEEDLDATAGDVANESGSVSDERLQADLDQACDSAHLAGQCENVVPRREIGCDDEPVACLHQSLMINGWRG